MSKLASRYYYVPCTILGVINLLVRLSPTTTYPTTPGDEKYIGATTKLSRKEEENVRDIKTG